MSGIVIDQPKNVLELLPLAGKVVLLNKAAYGVLAVNVKLNEYLLLSEFKQPNTKYSLTLSISSTFEEVTRDNIRDLGIMDSPDIIDDWNKNIQWEYLDKNWEHFPRSVSVDPTKQWDKSTGELIKNPYQGGGLNFL